MSDIMLEILNFTSRMFFSEVFSSMYEVNKTVFFYFKDTFFQSFYKTYWYKLYPNTLRQFEIADIVRDINKCDTW